MAPETSTTTFGFVGLGNMGSNMAQNLARYAQTNSLPRVRIWNRTRSKIEHLAQESHCEIVPTLQEVANQCNIIHTCLANDDVAFSVYRQFFTSSNIAGTTFADHSTLFPTTSSALQTEARSHGAHFLSCPVFGPPAAAKSAGLLVVCSGDGKAKNLVKGYLVPAIGKSVLDCGTDSAKGALMKILGNNCILGTIELLSEAFTLAEKTGFDAAIFYDFIQQWFPAPAWQNYGRKIRDGTFSGATGFKLDGGMKDATFIRRLGAETSTPTPTIDQAWNHLTTAKALGGDGLDWSACSAGMRVTAGLSPWKGEDFSLDGKNRSFGEEPSLPNGYSEHKEPLANNQDSTSTTVPLTNGSSPTKHQFMSGPRDYESKVDKPQTNGVIDSAGEAGEVNGDNIAQSVP